jgi:hypothetical protein
MSTLGSISGHLGREQLLLRELNSALLALEVDALGRTSDFGLSNEDVLRSRQTLLDFVVRLRAALQQGSTSIDIQPLVQRLKSGMKPSEDWCDDLDILVEKLRLNGKLEDNILPILEDVLSLLDIEFTEDLKRLYSR